MKKFFSFITVFAIALFVLPFSNTALADGEDTSTIAPDEAYEIDYIVKHETDDAASAADGFFQKPAHLFDKDGEKYVQLTVTSWSMIDFLKTNNGDVVVVKENSDDSALVQFKVNDDLSDTIDLNMHITVPDMYSMEHDARFILNTDSKKEIDISNKELITSNGGNGPNPEQPGETETPEPEEPGNSEEPTPEEPNNPETPEPEDSEEPESNQSVIDLENGSYILDVSYLRSDNDDSSSMGNYMDDAVFLTVKNNQVEVTITINEDETVTKLQVEGKNATEKVMDGDKRYETFTFDSLESILNAYVEYQAPYGDDIFEGNADFRISFDKDSVQGADPSDKPGINIDGDKGQNDGDKDKDKNKNDGKDNGKDKNKGNDKNKNKKKAKSAQADKAYEIDYIIKHATKDEASAADNFFKKPAYLLYKNGEKYLQLTVTNSDMIKSLKTDNGDVLIVKENADGSMVIQFKVDGDLSDVIDLNMFISVPDMPGAPGGYDMEHDARLFLDPSSKKEVDASNFHLVPGSKDNLNGPIIEGSKPAKTVGGNNNGGDGNDNGQGKGNNNKTPTKPTFGNGDSAHNGATPMKGNNSDNPKTGDTMHILPLSLLLIGSLIPLAIKARRRFV